MAEGLEFAQPSGENGSDAVERQLGVNAQEALGLTRGEVRVGVDAQAALELRQRCGGQSEADGEGVAAEAREKIGAGFDGGKEREAVDRTAGAVGNAALGAFLDADDDGGLGGALDDARGENADNTAMPSVTVDNEEAVGGDFGVGAEAGFNDGERGGFDIAPLAIEALEFGSQLGGAVRVARREEFDHVGGDVHTAGGVDARGEAKGDVEAGDLLAGGIERGGSEERTETGANGAAQLAQAERCDGAIFAVKGNGVGDGGDGRHLEKAGQGFFAGASGIAALEQRLRKLERDGRAAEIFFRIQAIRLIRVQDGEGGREFVVRIG